MGAGMTRIVAFIDDSHLARAVLGTAEELAELLGADVEPVTITDADGAVSISPGPVMVDRLRDLGVVAAVLGSRAFDSKPEPFGHVAAHLLTRSPIPLVLVPPTASGFGGGKRPRLLLPLDADPTTDDALLPMVTRLRAGGARIGGLHVYSSETVPRFLGSIHDLETLADEFVVQHLPGICDDCELRIGAPEREIIDRASAHDIDGVIVAWRQDLSPGRGEVIRRLLAEAGVPVLIVPVDGSRPPSGRHRP